MFRRHRLIIAVLIVAGNMFAAERLTCSGAEPPNAGLDSPFDSSAVEPVVSESSESKFLLPRTWNLGPDITLQLRGRIDTDSIWSSQTPTNRATFGNLEDVVGLRRARIGAEGKIGEDGRYVAEIDLASGEAVPRDVYFAFGSRQETAESQFGHFREPFSLEGSTSARYLAFMERSPINLLDPARNWGLGLYHESLDKNSALAVGVFHAGSNASDFQGGDGSTVGFTGRLTMAPINEKDGKRLLHFGAAISERLPENGVILINQQPRSPLLDLGDSSTSPFVPVIRIPARYQQLANLQFAAARGSWWTQAEWYGTLIDQTGGGNVFFRGCHVDCGYFLTGEHRGYDSANGTFGAIRVNRPWIRGLSEGDRELGWGAWELTGRFAYLDFVDPNTPLGPNGQRLGIQLPQWTFGVNWYMTDRMRLMFNYSYDTPNEINTGKSSANIFGTRLAVFW